MGADLLVAWAAWPRDKHGNDIPADRLQERILEDIATLDDESLANVFEYSQGEDPLEVEEEQGTGAAEAEWGDWRETARERLRQGVTDLFGDMRSTIYFEVRGVRVLMAGGTSWGDSPSDGYDGLHLLNVAELLYDEEA